MMYEGWNVNVGRLFFANGLRTYSCPLCPALACRSHGKLYRRSLARGYHFGGRSQQVNTHAAHLRGSTR
jgi:hypothetical protein